MRVATIRAVVLVFAALFVVALLGGAGFYVEVLWFNVVGYVDVLWTSILSRVLTGLGGGLAVGGFLLFNLWLAVGRPSFLRAGLLSPILEGLLHARRLRSLAALASVVVALLAGLSTSGEWLTVQLFLKRSEFGLADPLLGRDVGFYVFSLPFYRLAFNLAQAAVLLALAGSAGAYFLLGGLSFDGRWPSLRPRPARHLGLLVALYLAIKSFGYWLGRYELLYSRGGLLFGPGFSDVHARLPALEVLMVLAAVASALAVWAGLTGRTKPVLVGVAALVLVSVAMGAIYPALLQQFVVSPNELAREKPYIVNHIEFTRKAYGLDRIEEKEFPVEESLEPEVVVREWDIFQNIRLWDWRPLKDTYSQLQEIRQYYVFNDVDVDRYRIDGSLKQVMLAARELAPNKLATQAQTWVNRYLKYTHGYGVVMSPAADVTPQGLPVFYLKDIPPTGRVGLEVSRPEIYYGEMAGEPVVVRTREPEFDYPVGNENAYTTYEGQGGVGLGNPLTRLAVAARLGTYRLLFSGAITGESKVLLYRNVRDRVKRIAPFLALDQDPYLVVNEGRLFWIIDAYTLSSDYPYAEPFRGRFNYIRNSVKVVVDAYHGTVDFYVVDESDPLILSYWRVFPGLFKPGSSMPEGLRSHVRYPEDIFKIQSIMYTTYHMRDPVVFYNKEDQWDLPQETFAGKPIEMEPYYVIARLGENMDPEFLLITPFTPAKKSNMIAWLAARSDGDTYGQLLAFRFPKQKLVFGPMQVEGRIDQDPEISQKLTLWGQAGSQVIRGNLLVLPIGKSLVYVEPLYIQAADNRLPELKRVIVVHGEKVVMEPTLREALEKLFKLAPPRPGPDRPGEKRAEEGEAPLKWLVEEASRLYNDALERLKLGDWSGFGEHLDRLRETLSRLKAVAGEVQGNEGDRGASQENP